MRGKPRPSAHRRARRVTKNELAMRLARLLLLKEGGGTLESFESLLCLRSYFSELTLDELHQIAIEYGIEA